MSVTTARVVAHWVHPEVAESLAGCPRPRLASVTLKDYGNFDDEACARHGCG